MIDQLVHTFREEQEESSDSGTIRIVASDLERFGVSIEDIAAVEALFTPQTIRNQSEFPQPVPINPVEFPDFDSLKAAQNDIRDLFLLPVKTDEEYKHYHAQSRDELDRLVQETVQDESVVLAPNAFPYALPADLTQQILWLPDAETPDFMAASFIARILKACDLTTDDLIVFERSLNTSVRLVRGTYPAVRHIHVWLREKGTQM